MKEVMEASANIETYTLQIPQADARFLSALAKKMGWTKRKTHGKTRVKKSNLELALEDIEKGELKSFDSVDSLMAYLHS